MEGNFFTEHHPTPLLTRYHGIKYFPTSTTLSVLESFTASYGLLDVYDDGVLTKESLIMMHDASETKGQRRKEELVRHHTNVAKLKTPVCYCC